MALFSQGSGNPQRDLNHMSRVANEVRLGDILNDVITNLNYNTAQTAALLTALAAASGGNVPSLTAVVALTAPSPVTALTVKRTPEIPGDRP